MGVLNSESGGVGPRNIPRTLGTSMMVTRGYVQNGRTPPSSSSKSSVSPMTPGFLSRINIPKINRMVR